MKNHPKNVALNPDTSCTCSLYKPVLTVIQTHAEQMSLVISKHQFQRIWNKNSMECLNSVSAQRKSNVWVTNIHPALPTLCLLTFIHSSLHFSRKAKGWCEMKLIHPHILLLSECWKYWMWRKYSHHPIIWYYSPYQALHILYSSSTSLET